MAETNLDLFERITSLRPTTLAELLAAIRLHTRRANSLAHYGHLVRELEWDSLPTFGGVAPVDTFNVWSWDADSLLVGWGADLVIVPRNA